MLLAALLLTIPAQPCTDTISCHKQAAVRKVRFSSAVSAEPPTERLGVELLTTYAFIDRSRGLVYALTPSLAAFDLNTGAVKWKHPATAGDTLWRAGKFLVVGSASSKFPPTVTFVDPEAPLKPTTCTLTLDAPKVAEDAALDIFDRGGQPYVYWRSSGSHRGCGLLKVDPATCAATKVPPKAFFFEPLEGCSYNSAVLDIPAVAASMPPPPLTSELSVKAEQKEKVSAHA